MKIMKTYAKRPNCGILRCQEQLGLSREVIQTHVNWTQEHELLLQQKKKAIRQWRMTKNSTAREATLEKDEMPVAINVPQEIRNEREAEEKFAALEEWRKTKQKLQEEAFKIEQLRNKENAMKSKRSRLKRQVSRT
jgi:hypothetical protein